MFWSIEAVRQSEKVEDLEGRVKYLEKFTTRLLDNLLAIETYLGIEEIAESRRYVKSKK